MKIGILTYHRPHNYGALLQAFSLKKYLGQIGNNAEIIDYWPPYHSEIYKIFFKFSKLSNLSKIKKILFTIIDFYRIFKRRNGYSSFCQKYLGLARKPQYLNQKSLSKLYFDIVIYGSDQIWRKQNFPLFKGFDEIYFGKCVSSKKKITYAASMGITDLNDEDELFIKKNLNNFDTLSVREAELKKIISKLTKKDVQLVLDPVFLLEKNEWQRIVSPQKIGKKYVFLFNLLTGEDSVLLANKVAEFLGYGVVEIPGTNVNTRLIGKRYKQTQSPLGFLSLISNASFIVSSSFHAIAFSLIFEKQFYSVGLNKTADRVKTLLDMLGIGQRFVTDVNDIDFKDIIDYEHVNKILSQNVEKSRNYLNHALNNNWEVGVG